MSMMKILINSIVCFLIAESFISAAPASFNDCVCGGQQTIKSRIKNGHKVTGHKYPWMAQIKVFDSRDSGDYYQCGGSLIDDQHVITAAHCVEKDDGSYFDAESVDVYLGRNRFAEYADDTDGIYKVAKIWVDPDYESYLLAHDLAIITLNETIKFTDNISPICLPSGVDRLEKFTIAGWGMTGSGRDDDTSERLLNADVQLVPKDKCDQKLLNWLNKTNDEELNSPTFNISNVIAETHMCAIDQKTGGDVCAGDSGGPLMYLGKDNRWFVVGIVSGSWADCGEDQNGASLYTRLIYYNQTIKDRAPSACWLDP